MNAHSTNDSLTLYIVLSPLYTLWQVCGLAPVVRKPQCTKDRMVFSGHRFLTPSTFWFFLSFLIATYNTSYNAKVYLRIRELAPLAYLAVEFMGKLTVLLTYGTCVTSNMDYLTGFNECLKFADERLGKTETTKFKVLGGLVVSVYVTLTVILVVTDVRAVGLQPVLLTAVAHKALVVLVTLQQVMLLLELWVRFRSLNADLLEASGFPREPRLRFLLGGPRPTRPPNSPVTLTVTITSLRELREAHVALTRAADLLQRHFGLPAACNVATCIFGGISSAYELSVAQVDPAWIAQFSLFQSAGVSAVWLAHHLARLVSLTLSSSAAADAASATGVILLRASAVCTVRGPDHEAFLRLTLMGPPLRFTPAGLFTVDRRLLLSGIAVIVTYVVILGQLTISH